MTDSTADLECLKRIQQGNARALEELYDRYTPLLYPLVLRILRSPGDAEDALQEAWLQIWKRAESFDPRRGSVGAWLVTVARTRALDRYRSMASRKNAETRADPERHMAPPEDPTVNAVRSQLSEKVRRALEELSPQQRQVIEIAYFEGLSQTEIAARLETPLGTVKSWTRQALQRLRERVPEEEWV
jgi:RNA polymerase sigma-70 factor (ECF subfamily)